MPPHLLVERQALGGGGNSSERYRSGFPLSSSAFAGSGGRSSCAAAAAGSSPPPFSSSFLAPPSAAAFVAAASAGGGGAPPLSCSVKFGAGRKLTGAAAARFRCDVLRQTGFLEPGQPGSVAAERSAEAAPATVGARET